MHRSLQSHPKLTQTHPNSPQTHPKLTPNSPQTHPKLTPNSPQTHPKLTPNSPQTHPKQQTYHKTATNQQSPVEPEEEGHNPDQRRQQKGNEEH